MMDISSRTSFEDIYIQRLVVEKIGTEEKKVKSENSMSTIILKTRRCENRWVSMFCNNFKIPGFLHLSLLSHH